ncbi:hypothetical protein GQ600_3618 [Phytophthora cactorum]|nr:hypothetical protein GQ600_3618 [Phytophthora cactorum]
MAWDSDSRLRTTSNSEWNMPTLLQVGTIEGTLNDVMYGLASFDAVGTLIKSSYTAEEVVDAETLYELQGPTPEEPFRFLGIKWVVKSTSSSVKAFVWPRDLTFIAATGILNRQGGERVGYHLMHSVISVKAMVLSKESGSARACSTCCVKKKLSFPGQGHKTVEQRSVVICTHCLTHARKLNSLEIAEQEVTERQQMNRRRGTLRGTGMSTLSIRSRSNSRPDINGIDVEPSPPANENRRNSRMKRYSTLPPFDGRKTVTKQNLSKNDAEIPIVAHPDVWDVDSDTDYEVDYVVTSQTHPEVPILGDALPEAVVQYAWGAVVPSPTNKESSEAPAPWPSPPSSPLPSPTPLPKEKEDSWPTTQGERASVWTPPVSQPTTIPRIHAGASTQEVLAQFAELCNAAENVYQAARKHTITHLDTTVLPTRQNNTRLDMSAVD